MLKDLVSRNRSYRRFYEEHVIDREALRELVDLARLSASGANKQPIKYALVADREGCEQVFPLLGWAGYLADWDGPQEGERPSAYIVMLGDREASSAFGADHGIAAQSILLGATEKGLGGCIIATVEREVLAERLGLAEHYKVVLVLALGKPKETVVVDPVGPDGDIKYWRDEDGVHHVPKRALGDIIVR
jgi:nitroreductase